MNDFTFKKVRSFSEIFQASTDFLKQEGKFFLKVLALYAGPFILIAAVASTYYQQSIQQLFLSEEFINAPLQAFGGGLMLIAIAGLLSNTMLYAAVYGYIKLYTEKGSGNFSQEDVWQVMKDNFLMILITSIVIGVVIFIGFMLFVIPGIYLAVPLSLIFIVRMQEGLSLSEGFKRVFRLAKSYWWQTLGLIIVASILVFFLQMFVSIPQTIYTGVKQFQAISDGSMAQNDVIYLLLGTATSFLSSLAGSYLLVVLAIQYFNLTSYHDFGNLNQRVQELYGNQQTQDNE